MQIGCIWFDIKITFEIVLVYYMEKSSTASFESQWDSSLQRGDVYICVCKP